MDALVFWSKGTFSVSRPLYNDNESLCVVVDNAIWHEVERLKFSVGLIKNSVQTQIQWLNSMDSEINNTMTTLISKRYAQELACTARLLIMIGTNIENAEPIREEWILAADAISVHTNSLTFPFDLLPADPLVEELCAERMNEQMRILSQQIDCIRTGNVVLEEDTASFLSRSLSSIGPFEAIGLSDSASLSHVTLPKSNRSDRKLLSDKLIRHYKLPGIEEHVGVADADYILAIIREITHPKNDRL